MPLPRISDSDSSEEEVIEVAGPITSVHGRIKPSPALKDPSLENTSSGRGAGMGKGAGKGAFVSGARERRSREPHQRFAPLFRLQRCAAFWSVRAAQPRAVYAGLPAQALKAALRWQIAAQPAALRTPPPPSSPLLSAHY
ncbi:hypothetical protein JB92DRAFT_3135813 [Gautieria morchelliformis]|nr:hypothetical protein JB92DRAFT_3135813 [Gautieria morchelliformis]